jgi:thymidylate kinase
MWHMLKYQCRKLESKPRWVVTRSSGVFGQDPDRGLPAPDAVVYLDLPIEVAEARGGFGEERYETRELQNKVLRKFQQLNDGTWHIVDASMAFNDVHKEVHPFTVAVQSSGTLCGRLMCQQRVCLFVMFAQ